MRKINTGLGFGVFVAVTAMIGVIGHAPAICNAEEIALKMPRMQTVANSSPRAIVSQATGQHKALAEQAGDVTKVRSWCWYADSYASSACIQDKENGWWVCPSSDFYVQICCQRTKGGGTFSSSCNGHAEHLVVDSQGTSTNSTEGLNPRQITYNREAGVLSVSTEEWGKISFAVQPDHPSNFHSQNVSSYKGDNTEDSSLARFRMWHKYATCDFAHPEEYEGGPNGSVERSRYWENSNVSFGGKG